VLVVFFALLAAGAFVLLPSHRIAAFLAWAVFLAAVLMVICRVKGEPPSWRWGK
jgi:non-ribosomal peptide synthetase component E (peptide arylation enzyme)